MVRQKKSSENCKSKTLDGAGFTLVELLVVVGIIVTLAAVVIPSVSQLSGRGKAGAEVQEFEAVQSAMDNLMVDSGVVTVNTGPGTSKNNWTTFPNGDGVPPLETYLRDATTAYYYCWNANGLITDQHLSSSACP